MKSKVLSKRQSKDDPVASSSLAIEIRALIEAVRSRVATAVNAERTLLYWHIGHRIQFEVLKGARAGYGEEIVATLSQQLTQEYGDGYSYSALTRMVKFASLFPDHGIVATLSQTLSWSHFRELLPLEKPMQRDFYGEMCRLEGWNVRTLRSKVGSMLFERTALSKKPDALAKLEIQALRDEDRVSTNLVLRDPYLFDFLGLKGAFLEKDLESAILRDLELFIMELGTGFTFVARQKRITVDEEDFYIDLLFYHRDLRRLVALELKLDKFRPEHKGQMEFYLRWLDKYERKAGEEAPLGIILCSSKDAGRIELLELDKSGIHVAEYLTTLPPKKILETKLRQSIESARQRFASPGDGSESTPMTEELP